MDGGKRKKGMEKMRGKWFRGETESWRVTDSALGWDGMGEKRVFFPSCVEEDVGLVIARGQAYKAYD